MFLCIHLKIYIHISIYPSKNFYGFFYLSIYKFLSIFSSIHLEIFIYLFIHPTSQPPTHRYIHVSIFAHKNFYPHLQPAINLCNQTYGKTKKRNVVLSYYSCILHKNFCWKQRKNFFFSYITFTPLLHYSCRL